MDELINGRWYWVSRDNKEWFPALRYDNVFGGGWSNNDTWEDFHHGIRYWQIIPLPKEIRVPEVGRVPAGRPPERV